MTARYSNSMAILIDPPLWPAHGTVWSHLVSDSGYDELHEFAARMPLPRRGFDLDHYDVPESLYNRAISLGAKPVGSREVVHRLRDSGLRVRQADRETERPVRRRQYLLAEWEQLARVSEVTSSVRAREGWHYLGSEILSRWNEPHRSYHDERHLEDVLLSLNHLATRGERLSPVTLLAAWFHDAVYTGRGADEQNSAQLAVESLSTLALDPALVQQVGELIIATDPTRTITHAAPPLAHLLDADLSIFASSDARYLQYTMAVRAEYAHVPDIEFREGRANILRGYLNYPTIYRMPAAQQLWESRARANLTNEMSVLLATAP